MKKLPIFNLINACPNFLAFPFVRRMIKLKYDPLKEISFKIATSRQEYEQAFSIVYERYDKLDYIDKCSSGMSYSQIHLLPLTFLLIVKEKDEVIGVMSIILDSGLGLPVESCWDISKERNSSHRIAEIGSLAISKKVEKRLKGLIFLPLSAFMYRTSAHLLGVDKIVIATSKKASIFYKAILLFSSLGKAKYSRVKGNYSECQVLDFNTAYSNYEKIYKNKALQKNVFNFMVKHNFEEFIIPNQSMSILLNSRLSLHDLEYFLNKKNGLFSNLTSFEKLYLAKCYSRSNFRFDEKKFDDYTKRSGENRYIVKYPIQIVSEDLDNKVSGFALDICRNGLQVSFLLHQLEISKFRIVMKTPEFGNIFINVEIVWKNNSKTGLRIIKSKDEKWNSLLDFLDKEVQEKPQAKKHLKSS